jgi:KRAB domain-containing zinc finger protein
MKNCPWTAKFFLFSRKEQLDNHVVTHLETKPFSCGECQKQFKFISDLRDHFKTHLEMDTNATSALLECVICFKLLVNKISLQNDMQIHTGDYPFICIFHSKMFRFVCEVKCSSSR